MRTSIAIFLSLVMSQTALIPLAHAQEVTTVTGGTLISGPDNEVRLAPPPPLEMGRLIRMGEGTLVLTGTTNVNATERGTFLGVVTTPLAPALREQLKLKTGLGVLVESVDNDSPAAAAGIKQYDVLEKLDDQWLINAQQLAVLVRTHAANDKVALSLIRQGQRQTVSATLAEKDVPVLDFTTAWGLPTAATTFTTGNLILNRTINGTRGAQLILNALRDAPPREMKISTTDDHYSIDYTVKDGKTQLKVNDHNGAVIFDGPADTAEQRQALPEEVQTRLKAILNLPKP